MLRLNLELTPSKFFNCVLLLVISVSLGIIISIPLFIFLKILLALLVLSYGFYIFFKYGILKHSRSITHLVFDEDGWQLISQGKVVPVRLLGDSTLTTFLCVLRFKEIGRFSAHSCLIFKNTIGFKPYRRLLMVLRCSK